MLVTAGSWLGRKARRAFTGASDPRRAQARSNEFQGRALLDEGHCFRHKFTSLDVKDFDEMNKAHKVSCLIRSQCAPPFKLRQWLATHRWIAAIAVKP